MMRNVFIVFLITATVTKIIALHEDDEAWVTFKINHKRAYTNEAEEEMRYKIFQESKKLVEENQAAYAKGEATYKLTLNSLSDRTDEELKSMRGLKIEKEP